MKFSTTVRPEAMIKLGAIAQPPRRDFQAAIKSAACVDLLVWPPRRPKNCKKIFKISFSCKDSYREILVQPALTADHILLVQV